MWAVVVVGTAVTGKPAGKFGMGVLPAHRRNPLGIRRVDSEFQPQSVGRLQIHRHAKPVIGLAHRDTRGSRTLHQLIERALRHLECDVLRAAVLLRGSPALPCLFIGVLEECQRTAILYFEEGVAEVHLAADIREEHPLAPGCDQGNS